MKDQFWINDYSILFRHNKLMEVWPYQSMTYEQQLNATTRFVILVSLFGYALLNNYVILLFGIILILGIVLIFKYNKKAKIEDMANLANNDTGNKPITTNPLQNVLLTDYTDNVNKPEASKKYNSNKEEDINNKVKNFIYDNS